MKQINYVISLVGEYSLLSLTKKKFQELNNHDNYIAKYPCIVI